MPKTKDKPRNTLERNWIIAAIYAAIRDKKNVACLGCRGVTRVLRFPTLDNRIDSADERSGTHNLTGRAALSAEPTQEADPGFLWDFWYPALRSSEVVGTRLAKAMLLEVPLVLGRTSEGIAFAMRDSCPHRGIPLS